MRENALFIQLKASSIDYINLNFPLKVKVPLHSKNLARYISFDLCVRFSNFNLKFKINDESRTRLSIAYRHRLCAV